MYSLSVYRDGEGRRAAPHGSAVSAMLAAGLVKWLLGEVVCERSGGEATRVVSGGDDW